MEIPIQPGRKPESLASQEDALKQFEDQARAYAEARAQGGVDLSEPRDDQITGDDPLSALGIHNRADARRAGLRSAPKRHKRATSLKARKAAKKARKRNRG
jgi:hypothetical protein